MTRLSVNVNKIAVLRNARGGDDPDICAAASVCMRAGCHGITVHPRPDGRHVRAADVRALAGLCGHGVEFNIEGNGFAAPRAGYPGLLALVREAQPAQCTLVPDTDGQLTSDHGFNLSADASRLRALVKQLKDCGTRVSLFIDAGTLDVERAAEIGADRIELYTGPYAAAHASGDAARALADCVETARRARAAGLGVNAGHDLNQGNLGELCAAIDWIDEVSIGHALIADALYAGLDATVRAYLAILHP